MKIWLFRIITICIPVFFFLFVELTLRLFGYGQVYPLFIENPSDTQYLLPRPDVVKRYFANQTDIPPVSIEANFFRREKPQNGLRFFVQGGSTAAGFPYGLSGSIAGMLDQRLKQTYPDHYVEVINTALAAVNSFTVLDMVDEIIAQKPDAVLIYMGHNEYLGILGVGSNYTAANSTATTLLFLKLKELRLFQLLQNLYHGFKNSPITEQADSELSRTFMAKVAKHKNIPFDSDIFRAGLSQFETNLGLILEKYQAAKVPVYLSTITSNVLGQAPFSSNHADQKTIQALDKLTLQLQQNKLDKALLAETSNKTFKNESAESHYRIGRILFAVGELELAKRHLTLAKDHDLLRFRAPEKINDIILSQGPKYGANIVNAQQRFEQRSNGKIVGSNLMLEHLHPNVEGYFLLSDVFYQALKRDQNFAKWLDVPVNIAWKQRPLLPAEEYLGYAKVQQLKSDYPFVEEKIQLKLPFPKGWEQKLGSDLFNKKYDWLAMAKMSRQNYARDGNVEQVLKTQLLIADAIPNDVSENINAAKMLTQRKDPRALSYYQRAIWAGDMSDATAKLYTAAKMSLR